MPPSQILILLGSGATQPDIPNVTKVTEHLLGWDDFLEPMHRDGVKRFHKHFAGEDRRSLFRYLQDELEALRPSTPITFEHLIHVLEFLDSLCPIPPEALDELARPILAPFLSPRMDLNVASALGEAAHRASNEVLRLFHDSCEKLEHTGRELPLVSGLRRLAGRHRLLIASLNYDDVPEWTGLHFRTGYGRVDPFDFEPQRIYSNIRGHLHLQLHGSVRFGDVPMGFPLVPRFRSRAEALKHRGSGRSRIVQQDGFSSTPKPLITGLRKSDKILIEPYASYSASFRRLAASIDTWLVIGYGGGDDHVNSVLRGSQLMRASSHRPGPKIFVVDRIQSVAAGAETHTSEVKCQEALKRLDDWAVQDLVPALMTARDPLDDRGIIRPKAFNQLSDRLWVSYDGVGWAMSDGLDEIESHLTIH